jgi:serine/threonine-protein kinase
MKEPTPKPPVVPLAAVEAPSLRTKPAVGLPSPLTLLSESSADITGRTLGEYQILSRIGAGGMGVVYEGRHPLIGKRVAVKVLLPELTSNPDQVSRFLSEARAVNAARHRGIVDIFSFGQLPDGAHYFVMEYLEGEGFDRLIAKRAPLLVGEALFWTAEVLEALSAAHEVGIIHRDIKPSNLFLVTTGHGRPYVKVLDFGIAKAEFISGERTPTTRASVVVGTPEYMSPEQVRGLPTSPATDLYCLGCVLFELLTGRRLFVGENATRTMWMHSDDAPPRAATFNPSVPKAVDDLLQWVLRKNANERPQSADEMRQHVEALLLALPPELAPKASSAFAGRPEPRPSSSTPAPTPVPTFAKAVTVLEGPAGHRASSPPPQSKATPSGRSRAAWVGLGALVAAAVGLGGWVVQSRVMWSSGAAPAPAAVLVRLPLTSPASPEEEAKPRVAAEPVAPVVEPKPAPPVSQHPGKVPSKAHLVASLGKLEAALVVREEAFGERDRVLRPFLEQARQAVTRASTEAERRDAATFLSELADQLKP